jgi:hypothetical protein
MAWSAASRFVLVPLFCNDLCRKLETNQPQEFLSQLMLSRPALLNDYMKTAIRITEPEDVRNSPDAQRIRAAMISAASHLLPLYDRIGDGPAEREERAAVMSSVQVMVNGMHGAVKCMVLQCTPSHLAPTPQANASTDTVRHPDASTGTDLKATDESVAPTRDAPSEGRSDWNGSMWQDATQLQSSVYYCLGPLWPLVQLALADKLLKLTKGPITIMSVMRAALPLLLRSTTLRHITPIITCMQRCELC